MADFNNQVVLITGASAGIGKEAAKQFAQLGAKLALCDINSDALSKTVEQLTSLNIDVFHQECDVSDETQVASFIDNTIKHFGRIDAAVNNAGIDPPHHLLADIPTQDYEHTMNVNVKGVFLCMKYQIPHMIAQGGGAICNMSSVAGVGGAPHMSVYAASKHAVIGLTKSAACEYGKKAVRVNAVCPYITMTDMFEQTLAILPDREEAIQSLGSSAALKRVAQPEEIVQAIIFACDKNNSYMTGHELVIDGGMTAI